MAATRSSAATEEAPPPPARKSGKGLIIAAAIAALVMSFGGFGVGIWFLAQAKHSASAEESSDKPDKPDKADKKADKSAKGKDAKDKESKERKAAVFVPMDPFTVNLRGQGREHYLQTTLVLETAEGPGADSVKALMPVIRSQVLLLLASKSVEDLITPEGKERLASEVLDRVRQPTPGPAPLVGIERVHFAAFIIQ